MRRASISLALLVACGSPAAVTPITAEPPFVPPPASRAETMIIVTNAGASPLSIDEGLGLAALDLEGTLAPMGLYLPPYPCECACDVAECPCTSTSEPSALAPGASVERRWDGAIRSLRRHETGVPCHERRDPPAGRYVLVACAATGLRCGTTEVTLPTRGPITITIPEEPTPADCSDEVRVRRAARLALAAARLEGTEDALLADCEAAAARCGEAFVPPEPGEPPDRCTIGVGLGEGYFAVRVTPTARDGSPIEVEAWIDAAAIAGAGRVDVARTRWATSSDGEVLVAGVPRTVSHTHGGDPAHIGQATLRITNRSDAALPIAVTRVEWLTLGQEMDVPSRGASVSVLPPRATTEIAVGFDAQPAYATYHERFASRVTLDVGGRSVVATVEHHVLRRDPIRR